MRKITSLSRTLPAMLGAGALAIGISSAADATVISGSSSSYAESINLTTSLLGVVTGTITSGPAPTASGTAPPPYSTVSRTPC